MNKFKLLSIFVLIAMVLGACGSPATEAPAAAATEAPAAAATEAPAAAATEAPAVNLPDVAREDTVVLGWSITSPIGVTNPWAVPGYTHQEGNVFMWEALAYYGIFSSKEIPWLADSMEYNADFTQLTIKLNKDAAWSDGTPVTSKDVVFTFDGQMNNDKLPYHSSFDQFVKDMSAPDDQTVVVNFKIPAPRFKYEVLTFKFDTGIPIVPEHVLGAEADVNAFHGGLDMPHSGPYNLVQWDANQKIYDLRPDWWAVKAGKIAVPAVKRIVMVNIGGQVGQNMDIVVQRLVNNEFDAILDVRAQCRQADPRFQPQDHHPYRQRTALRLSRLVAELAVDEHPAGSLQRPERPPRHVRYDRSRHRSTKSSTMAPRSPTIYPFPLYPNLQKFADSAAVQAEFKANASQAMQTGKADLAESDKLMTAAGFTKNGDGLWEKDGADRHCRDQRLSKASTATSCPCWSKCSRPAVSMPTSTSAPMPTRTWLTASPACTCSVTAPARLIRTLCSICTPAATPSRSAPPPATTASPATPTPRWMQLLDTMAPLSADDPKFQEAAAKAMGIYWNDTIDCPIIQWLHRIPYNQTYWTNWPTAANPAMGTNGAFWAETGMLVITSLEKAK